MNYAIAMIKEKDKDGDGQLSIKEDSRWLAETFAEIDTNSDGQLSMEEYASKAARDDEDRKRMQGQSNNR